MATESDIMERIRCGGLRLPPADLRILSDGVAGAKTEGQADLLIEAKWQGERFRFVAEVSRLATPLAVEKAMSQALNTTAHLGPFEPPQDSGISAGRSGSRRPNGTPGWYPRVV